MTDYSDLVKRLRDYPVWTGDCHDAADAIEAQAKRIAELEAALKPFALGETAIEAGHNAASDDYPLMQVVSCGDLRQARKVLGEKE